MTSSGSATLNNSQAAVRAALFSSVLAVCMGVALGICHKIEPKLSTNVVSLFRVLMNGAVVFALLVFSKQLRGEILDRSPDRHILLWAFFGSITVHAYTYAVLQLGMGMATLLLQCFQALAIATLSPLLARERWNFSVFLSLACCFIGVLMIHDQGWGAWEPSVIWGALAGISAALAYMMLVRARNRFSSGYAMFYWTAFSLVSHSLSFTASGLPILPSNFVLFMVIIAGIFAAIAQFFSARAYQNGPAMRVTVVMYLAPILGMTVDSWIFGRDFGVSQAIGTGLVLFVSFRQFLPSAHKKMKPKLASA